MIKSFTKRSKEQLDKPVLTPLERRQREKLGRAEILELRREVEKHRRREDEEEHD